MVRPSAVTVMTALGFPHSLDRLYQRLVGQSGRPLREVAAALLMSPAELRKELGPLVDHGIVRVEDGAVYVDSPAELVARLLADAAGDAARAGSRLHEIAAAIPLLAGPGVTLPAGADDVLPIDGEVQAGGDVAALAVEFINSSQGEILWLRPDQFRLAREEAMIAVVTQAITDGRRSRAIYPVRAMVEARDVLAARIAAGEVVRVLPEVPTRMAVFGSQHAVLPEPLGFADEPRLLVHQPGLVDALALWFEALWEKAHPVAELEGSRPQPDLRRLLLEQLASGAQDAQIARRLGLSLRTVRRRVAALFGELGAESRFQAGVEAVRRGWL